MIGFLLGCGGVRTAGDGSIGASLILDMRSLLGVRAGGDVVYLTGSKSNLPAADHTRQ